MCEIEVIQRRFVLELSESEAADIVLYIKKSSVISSSAYKVAESLQTKLGYEPVEDVY